MISFLLLQLIFEAYYYLNRLGRYSSFLYELKKLKNKNKLNLLFLKLLKSTICFTLTDVSRLGLMTSFT